MVLLKRASKREMTSLSNRNFERKTEILEIGGRLFRKQLSDELNMSIKSNII